MADADRLIRTRPAEAADQEFLFLLYKTVRAEEIGSWGWGAAEQEAFLRMQFAMQQRAYSLQFPGADQIICIAERNAGRFFAARTPQNIRLVDIAMLPEHRNQGIGGKLISELLDEAASKGIPVHLSVMKGNPAIHLYDRLGFRITAEEGLYLLMEWRK